MEEEDNDYLSHCEVFQSFGITSMWEQSGKRLVDSGLGPSVDSPIQGDRCCGLMTFVGDMMLIQPCAEMSGLLSVMPQTW